MFVVYTSPRIEVLGRYFTFEEAWDYLTSREDCVFAECDEDNENCADALLADGSIVCIEPAVRRGI